MSKCPEVVLRWLTSGVLRIRHESAQGCDLTAAGAHANENVCTRLADATLLATELFEIFHSVLREHETIKQAALLDIVAFYERVCHIPSRPTHALMAGLENMYDHAAVLCSMVVDLFDIVLLTIAGSSLFDIQRGSTVLQGLPRNPDAPHRQRAVALQPQGAKPGTAYRDLSARARTN